MATVAFDKAMRQYPEALTPSVDGGHIRIGEDDVMGLSARERDIAMVFQNYALYPHMTVGENMAFALKIAGVSKSEREERVREAARLLDLEP